MSGENRKDRKGRILLRGERQREDGRYEYRFVNESGERQTIYSWKLVETDNVPNGKRCALALRTMEKRVQQDIDDGIRVNEADKVTANERFDKWIADSKSVLDGDTLVSYSSLYNKHFRESLGRRKLRNIRNSDIKRLYTEMVDEKGLSVSTVQALNSAVSQMFQAVVDDEILRKNPAIGATFRLSTMHRGEKKLKDALKPEEQARLLEFVKDSARFSRVYNLMVVLFGTGMRISEAVGLVTGECSFRSKSIHIRRELRYRAGLDGHYSYKLKEKTKTEAGKRDIPMFPEVSAALKDEISKNRKKVENPFEIDGVSGFIFLNNAGKPFTPSHVYDMMQAMVKAFNKEETKNAILEHRKPKLLPHMSPHTCRHSFATRLHENRVDPLTIKLVMGHERYETSANTYTHPGFEVLLGGFDAVSGCMSLK